MSHIDTLKTYKDYLSAGYTEDQAIVAVNALDKSFDGLDCIRKADLDYAISGIKKELHDSVTELRHEFSLLRKEFTGLRWLVIASAGICIAPTITKLLGY